MPEYVVEGRHPRRRRRAASAVGVMLLVTATGCQISGRVTPDPVPVAQGDTAVLATLSWSGAPPLGDVFVDLCRRPTSAAGFDLATDCDPLSDLRLPGSPRGTGTEQVELFVGPTQDHRTNGTSPWACLPAGESAPEGLEGYDRCWVRLAWGDRRSPFGARSIPYRFTRDDAEIPEAPWAVLPVLLTVLVSGVAVTVRRRVRSTTS
jgi:hypothetical protein